VTPLRILGETAYPPVVASARVRIARLAPFLAPHGVHLEHHPNLSDAEYALLQSPAAPPRKAAAIVRAAGRAARARRPARDLLLVHRLRLLAPLPGFDPPRRLDVYDLDDALFLGSTAAVNRSFAWTKQEAGRCVACLRRARLVTAGNAFLAGHARKHGARVEVVPSCVDPDAQPQREHRDVEALTVGWIGTHSTVGYLRAILPALDRVRRDGVALRLVTVGAALDVDEPWIEARPWSAETEGADLASFDVGLMPLPDTEWARGKCGYKLLQYFAAGVPAVAAPVGVNAVLLEGGGSLAATNAAEWAGALRTLAADAAERRERGATARAFAEREFSYARWAPAVAALYKELAG
jgi:glycosyltransferase involved in cell wall biosynthesis